MKKRYVSFYTGPIGDKIPSLQESLPAPWKLIATTGGWLFLVANAHWAM